MKLKYRVRQTSAGKWAVWKTKTRYFTGEQYDTEADALAASLFMEGHEHLARLDVIQTQLENMKRVDERDPYGWRA